MNNNGIVKIVQKVIASEAKQSQGFYVTEKPDCRVALLLAMT